MGQMYNTAVSWEKAKVILPCQPLQCFPLVF